MKKNVKNLVSLLLITAFVMCSLVGCGSSMDGADSVTESVGGTTNDAFNATGDILDYENMSDSKGEGTTGQTSEENTNVSNNRKIIEKVHINAQTKEFDALVEKLTSEVDKIGGYIESSSVSGNSYSYDGHRYANFVVRVPSEKSDEFTAFVSDNSTVTNKEIDTEDVTLTYVDMESRVKALTTEKETLENLLARATNLNDVISIQDRLTDVIYEIESFKSKLKTYDNLIEFTTVTIRISEVERVTVVEEQTMWEEIGTNLKNNFEDVKDGLKELFVGVVSSIPYLLVFAVYLVVIITVVVLISKAHKKRLNKKKLKEIGKKVGQEIDH